MEMLNWTSDNRTALAASRYCPIPHDQQPASEFLGGRNFHTSSWEHRVVQPSVWPSGPLSSSPDQIIRQFQDGRFTQALAMVISWGTMWRTSRSIWPGRRPELIERVLRDCSINIQQSRSIAASWKMLAGDEEGQLGWTDVLTSKTLHFLCRSLGFERNPPVPIDGLIIVKRLWPRFWDHSRDLRPGKWHASDNGFDAYNRYMTAVRTWADQLQWSTTQVEQTMYIALYPEQPAPASGTLQALKAENARLLLQVAELRASRTQPKPPTVRADQFGRIVNR